MQAAYEYSDPYFKAQIQLATDALTRGIQGKDSDLAYSIDQKNSALKALRDNISASKDYLSFQNQQDLLKLARDYESNLNDARDQLAATGFTNSSKRARTEQLLGDANSAAVESSNRGFSYQTGSLDRQLGTNQQNTATDIQRLREMAQSGTLDLYRQVESQVGTANLPSFAGRSALGGVGGSIPRQRAADATSFANSFVF
jgi:hypothetical protein